MDKVRAILRVLWVQRFWVLSVIGVLIAFVSWMMASGSLQTEFAANQSKINAKFNDMTSITSAQYRGNERVNQENLKQASAIRKSVLDLWQRLYDKQRDEVLKWPDVLGEDFLAQVADKKFRDPINDPDLQQRYWNYIKRRFDALVAIVQAQKLKPGEMSGGYGGDVSSLFSPETFDQRMEMGVPGEPEPEPYIVKWLDQGELRQQLEFTSRPTSLQIWVTQEDLWVYENLLHAIANTNEEKNATRPDNAAIKGILSLNVGRAAAAAMRERGNIIMPPSAAASGGEMTTEFGPESRGEGMDPYGGPEGMLPEGADPEAVLLAGRYVNQEGAPIQDASTGFGTEYRRLPIRMRLWMDQRWIPKILVECANAPLPVEVQRLRINPAQSGVGFDSAMGGGGFSGGYGGLGGAYGGEFGRGAGGRGEFGGGVGMGYSAPSFTGGVPGVSGEFAEVDIQGLVYIFNEPDATALAVPGEESGEAGVADETVAAADAAVVR